MRFLFRLIPILMGLVTLTIFVWITFFRFGWWWIIAPAFFLLWYGLFELLGRRVREIDLWWGMALIFFFVASGLGFFMYLEGWVTRFLAAVVIALLVSLFTEQLYRWFYALKVPSYTLGVMVALLEVFTVFFLASDLIGLRIFLGLPVWALTLGFMVTVVILFLIARSIRGRAEVPVTPGLILGIFFGEVFWAVLVLPTGFMVGGAIVAIVWYTTAGLYRIVDLGLDVAQPAKRYLGLAAILLLLVALTARWV